MEATLKKADMQFRAAMKRSAEGDEAGADSWLEKAAATEREAILKHGEAAESRNLG